MRKVLEFDSIFVVKARMTKASGSNIVDENRETINQVLEATMDPELMN